MPTTTTPLPYYEFEEDYDLDGLSNEWEDLYGTDRFGMDSDGDRFDDGEEVHYWRTAPNNTDSDFDGLSDTIEISRCYGSSAIEPDSDFDGVNDSEEVADPLNPDTDDDGMSDGAEITRGRDPLDPRS